MEDMNKIKIDILKVREGKDNLLAIWNTEVIS